MPLTSQDRVAAVLSQILDLSLREYLNLRRLLDEMIDPLPDEDDPSGWGPAPRERHDPLVETGVSYDPFLRDAER